jgi:hypothetical protein
MNSDDVISQAEADEQVLTFDIPDDILEQTASAEHTAFTITLEEMEAFMHGH